MTPSLSSSQVERVVEHRRRRAAVAQFRAISSEKKRTATNANRLAIKQRVLLGVVRRAVHETDGGDEQNVYRVRDTKCREY